MRAIQILLAATLLVVTAVPSVHAARALAAGCAAATTVSTPAELTTAIDCFNAQTPAGDHTITLGAALDVVEQPSLSAAARLTLDGAGYTLRGDSSASFGFLFQVTAGAFELHDIGVESGFRLAGGVRVASGASLSLADAAMHSLGNPIVVDGGVAQVDNVLIDGAGVGVEVRGGGRAAVAGSSVGTADAGLWVEAGHLVVVNTTVADSDTAVGAVGGGSTLHVSLSTVASSGTGLSTANGASVVVRSSVVANNDTDCSGSGVTNDQFNYDTDGSCPGFAALAGSLIGPADNGCGVETVAGCTLTSVPSAASNLFSAGACSAIPVAAGVGGSVVRDTVAQDQRGFGRPVGGYCDAGAYEEQTLPVCDGRTVTIVWGPSASATAGDDVIWGTAGDDLIDTLAGNDTVCAGDGNDVVIGGDGNDRLFGEGGRDIMRGNTGRDHLDGGPGNDRLLGGIDDDELIGRDGDDYLGGFGGDDLISGGPGDETIYGGYGADRISGDGGDDVIHGLIGNDSIDGGYGNDELNGDAGSDSIVGGPGADVINGGNAGDVLYGEGGNDSVNGGRADDVLSGGFGTDVCAGNLHFGGDTTDGSCETVFGVP